MKLNVKNAEKFCKETFEKHLKGRELEWRIKHCKLVWHCCKLLVKDNKNKKIKIKALKIASWLHDIGRVHDDKEHPQKSLELIKQEFEKLDKVTEDCILNHSSVSRPETEEGKIFQIADKLSLLSPELFIESAKQDKQSTVNFFSENLNKLFELTKGFTFVEEPSTENFP